VSAYGLGVELAADAVRWATATSLTQVSEVTSVAASVTVVDGRLVGGLAALGAVTSASVDDIVAQFPVDRLWFVAGLMVTPDDALRALLAGLVDDVRHLCGGAPAAVTVTGPANWDEHTVGRLQAVVASLALPLVALRPSMDAGAAAGHAASRLPAQETADNAVLELPPLPAPALAPAEPTVASPAPAAVATAGPRIRRFGWAPWLLLVAGIPALVAVVVVATREPSRSDAASTTVPPTIGASAAPTTVAALPGVNIGFASAGGPSELLTAEVGALNAQRTLFPAGVFVVTQSIGADPGAVVTQLRGQGVVGIVSDATGPAAAAISSVARTAQVAVCLIGSSADAAVHGPGVVFATPASCVDLLGLGTLAAHAIVPARVADALALLTRSDGLPCKSFAQCAAYLQAEQPVSFTPDGGPVVPAPNQ
jgi:hypothetical protein